MDVAAETRWRNELLGRLVNGIEDGLLAIKTVRERASSYLGPESEVGKDPALSMRKRLDFLGARESKRKARERRLIGHLKHIEIDESRFS